MSNDNGNLSTAPSIQTDKGEISTTLGRVVQHIGLRRQTQEDFAILSDRVCIVADGMGGHASGELASEIAATTAMQLISDELAAIDSVDRSNPAIARIITRAFVVANHAVSAIPYSGRRERAPGTTMIVVVKDENEGQWVIGHVGDSRAWLCTGETMLQLTRDHEFTGGGLYNVVGPHDNGVPDIIRVPLADDHFILVATDGLFYKATDQDICWRSSSIDTLMEMALEHGGIDNITIASVRSRTFAGFNIPT